MRQLSFLFREIMNRIITDHEIQITEYKLNAPERMRAVVLSDFHNNDPGPVLDIVRKGLKPDVILIPGDVVLGYYPEEGSLVVENSSNIVPFLKGCCDIAPVFMSLGNHECLLCDADIEILKSTGITLLDNEWVKYGSLTIGGLTSGHVISYRSFRNSLDNAETYPSRCRPRKVSQLLTDNKWLDDFEKETGYKILLSHHPEYWCVREPYLMSRKFDLVLSGHAHGGQWRIFGHGVLAPGQGFFPKYTSGMHKGPYGRMIISRGLANPYKIFPRWGNPCELIYLEMGPDNN